MKQRATNPTFPIRSSQNSSSMNNTKDILWTLKDMHEQLFKLYSGSDASFKSLTCVNCANLAYYPSECKHCHRLTCRDCQQPSAEHPKGLNTCTSCNNSLGEEGDLHFIVANMLNQAVFRCPYGCGETNITLSELENHVQNECSAAFISCPNRCGETFHKKDLDEHRLVCTHEPITCDRCHQVTVPRHQITHH